MGRQIQICSTDLDNLFFEEYLRLSFDCSFFQSSASKLQQIEITKFSEADSPFGAQIFIWNKQFPWVPEYGQTNTKDNFYLSKTSSAPLIEFSKTVWAKQNSHGRIYWAKYFTAGPINYDMEEFEKFYQTIVKWIIKNSKGKVKSAGTNIYYFKDAWERYLLNLENGG